MRDKQLTNCLRDKTWHVSTAITSFEWSEVKLVNLSQVLEPPENVPQKYFLSAKAAAGILRRAEKRGKVLPEQLGVALRAVAQGQDRMQMQAYQTLQSLEVVGYVEIVGGMPESRYECPTCYSWHPTHLTHEEVYANVDSQQAGCLETS